MLVLNQNYEPLNVCNLPRAFRLVFGEKAEVIEYDHQVVRTPRTEFRAPSVIRLQYLIRRPRPRVKLSRREVFARDRHTCQYCGRQTHDLTLDHVMPRHRGGSHTWENLVTACKGCNHRKGGKTLDEARLRLSKAAARAAQRHLLAVHAVPRRRAQRRVADVPLPGAELTESGRASAEVAVDIPAAIPASVHQLLATLWDAGHAAYVVGGSLRDALLGVTPKDWDLATSAVPEATLAAFPEAVYENAFGTVAVATDDPDVGEVEITTFRSDHDYADFRRPHRIEFTDSIEADLARRDLTVNAMAWGAPAGAAPAFVDPFGGADDLGARVLRAVGDPLVRFEEDALRMLRTVRLSATLDFAIEPATLAAIQARADLVKHLSGERIAAELTALLAAPTPSIGLRALADLGLIAPFSPELAAQRGIPQNKIEGDDLWDHTMRAVDGAVTEPSYIRLAAMVHDIGKPATMADGQFLGHDVAGAAMAGALLDRLRWRRDERDRVVHIVRHHMYGYVPSWSDAAVRRFIVKVGQDALDDLFLLREADNVGSGRDREGGGLAEIRARVAAQLAAGVPLRLDDLAIDGRDVMQALALAPGPEVGRILDALLERVIGDPVLNTRDRLLKLARMVHAELTP